ncbi:hypothetical protein PG995_002949 [Apiospora arundinis]|uniref:MACPF-like domain-containing protein n=1 Tax=Apiospora arundinis TaxID=335852 RepID=A0ABR2J4X4_9PEZI
MGDTGTSKPTPAPTGQDESDATVKVSSVGGKEIKELAFLLVPKGTMEDPGCTLASLREAMTKSMAFKDFARLSFCAQKGAIFADSYLLQAYLGHIREGSSQTSKDTIIDVYLQKDVSDSTQTESTGFGRTIDAQKLAYLKQSFDENAFKILTGTAAKYTAELDEQDWSILVENNSLCYGIQVIRRKKDDKTVAVGVERARLPAFRLKEKAILSNKLTTTSARDVEVNLRIPDYWVDDQSYVSIFETTSDLQSSLAYSSFSSFEVEAAGSGSIFGCSLEASASYSQSSKAATTAKVTSHKTQVTIAYNFPRVTVSLGSDDLELTTECKAAFAKVTTSEAMKEFLADYGEFFSSRVQLGGRLFATEEAESETKSATDNVKKSMKAAASVSFSGGGYGASASTSAASQSSASTASKSSNSVSTLTWQANGGDTLLCNDPPAWCPSVAYHWNWRITKQDKTTHIIDVIKNMRGYSQLADSLASLRDAAKEDADSVMEVLQEKNKVVVDGRFTLQLEGEIEGRYVTARAQGYFNLKDTCKQYNDKFGASVSSPGHFTSKGAILIGPTSASYTIDELKWHARTGKGEMVEQLCYNTPYRLQTKKEGWYFQLDSTAGIMWLYGQDQKRTHRETNVRVAFRNADSSHKTSTPRIEDGASVTMHFCEDTNPSKELGHAFIAGRDNHRIYLAVSTDAEKYKPVRLTIRNRDW